MTITVSVSQFRQNISDYLAQAQAGHTIILRDGKKRRELAQVTTKKKWDPVAFEIALKKATGIFTAKNHPEWSTKRDVIRWVERERAKADRIF